ncbi:MAG: transporter [Polyangiaceae bacterium]
MPYYHHVALLASDTSLDASYGLLPWLAVEGRFTLRVVDTTPTYSELDGSPKLVPDDIHHHDRTLVGPGDPWLVARFAGQYSGLSAAARLGVSLPVGLTRPDPYAAGARGESHEHTQLGTGTVVPIVGLGLSYRVEPIVISASGLAFFSAYENEHGFRAPTRYFASVRATWPLLDGKLSPYVAADLSGEGEEIWHGSPGLEGSNVRADLLLGGGLAWQFAPDWQVELNSRGRAARFTGARGFDYPGVAQVAVSTHFDTTGAKQVQAPSSPWAPYSPGRLP